MEERWPSEGVRGPGGDPEPGLSSNWKWVSPAPVWGSGPSAAPSAVVTETLVVESGGVGGAGCAQGEWGSWGHVQSDWGR